MVTGQGCSISSCEAIGDKSWWPSSFKIPIRNLCSSVKVPIRIVPIRNVPIRNIKVVQINQKVVQKIRKVKPLRVALAHDPQRRIHARLLRKLCRPTSRSGSPTWRKASSDGADHEEALVEDGPCARWYSRIAMSSPGTFRGVCAGVLAPHLPETAANGHEPVPCSYVSGLWRNLCNRSSSRGTGALAV